MTADSSLCCPQCGSDNIFSKGDTYLCADCFHQFESSANASSHDGPGAKTSVSMNIFLSYGHPEHEIVEMIRDALVERGHDVWIDTSGIKTGEEWRERIASGIAASNGVIACLSKHSVRDPGVCLDELGIAIGVRGGNIKTVLLESEKEVQAPAAVSHIQWLDMSAWREKLAQGDDVFQPWFKRCVSELIKVIESDDSVRFAGDLSVISDHLIVLADTTRQSYLLARPFVGREWLADEIEAWLNDRNSPRVCLLTGDAGVGKSAFAAHVAYWGSKLVGSVPAAFFCEAGRKLYNDPAVVIQTLAYLIACRLAQYRVLLREALEKPVDLAAMNADELFTFLIGNPLSLAIDGSHENLCIIVDGIDEAGDAESNELAETLARYGERLPVWMKLLVTSRRVTSATSPFGTGVHRIDLEGTSDANKKDVREYFDSQLREAYGAEAGYEQRISALAEQSGGIFLYAELMVDAVLKGRASFADSQTCPRGLSEMFHQWFRWTFPDLDEYRSGYRDALGCVLAAPGGSLPESEFGVLFGWNGNELNDFLRRVEVLIRRCTTNLGEPAVAISHAFVAEWIASSDAGAYQSLPEDALSLMGRKYHEVYGEGVEKLTDYELINICTILKAVGLDEEFWTVWSDAATFNAVYHLISSIWDRDLCRVASDIAEQQLALLREHPDRFPVRRARILTMLGGLYDMTNMVSESEACVREAIDINRGRVAGNPGKDGPLNDLAFSLNRYGCILLDLGQPSQAGPYLRESLEIRKELARDDERYNYSYAASLTNVGNSLRRVHRADEASGLYREAVAAYRDVISKQEKNTGAKQDLSLTLVQLAEIARDRREFTEAEAYYKEAIAIDESLVDEEGTRFLPRYVSTLNSYVWFLYYNGDYQQAEPVAQKALELAGSLVESNSEMHGIRLAAAYKNLACIYNKTGRSGQAEQASREACAIRKALADIEPKKYVKLYGDALCDLAVELSENGKIEEAKSCVEEALPIFRKLAEDESDAYEYDVADCLKRLATLTKKTGSVEDAAPYYEESHRLFRRVFEQDRATFRDEYVAVLTSFAYSKLKDHDYLEAIKLYEELEPLVEEQDAEGADGARGSLAHTLQCYGFVLKKDGRIAESLAPLRRALKDYLELFAADPDAYAKKLSDTTTYLVGVLKDQAYKKLTGQEYPEAIELYEELIPLLEEQLAAGKESAPASLAHAQRCYGFVLHKAGRSEASLEPFRKAIEAYRVLSEKDPDTYRSKLASALTNCASALKALGRADEASECEDEAKAVSA